MSEDEADLLEALLGEFRRVAHKETGRNPLSEREREGLRQVARGCTYRQGGARRAELIRRAADHRI